MSKTAKPVGVVGVVIGPDGHVAADATDFHRNRPAGFSIQEAQRIRVRDKLANEIVKRGCNDYIAKAMLGYDAQNLLSRLMNEHGFRVEYIPVGHEESKD